VRLPCRVSAEPVADITWLRNGFPLDGKSAFAYFLTTALFAALCAVNKCFE